MGRWSVCKKWDAYFLMRKFRRIESGHFRDEFTNRSSNDHPKPWKKEACYPWNSAVKKMNRKCPKQNMTNFVLFFFVEYQWLTMWTCKWHLLLFYHGLVSEVMGEIPPSLWPPFCWGNTLGEFLTVCYIRSLPLGWFTYLPSDDLP